MTSHPLHPCSRLDLKPFVYFVLKEPAQPPPELHLQGEVRTFAEPPQSGAAHRKFLADVPDF